MSKKKQHRQITVSKPKVGETYDFSFAGSIMKGILTGEDEKLSKNYDEPWFWFKVPIEYDPTSSREMKYPVSIYSIIGKSQA
jgi:hypothetical protein